jgi:hypothetical protein
MDLKESLKNLCSGLPLNPLPENRGPTLNIAHAAKRPIKLGNSDKKVCSHFYLFRIENVFSQLLKCK